MRKILIIAAAVGFVIGMASCAPDTKPAPQGDRAVSTSSVTAKRTAKGTSKVVDEGTVSQRNALRSAKVYLEMSGFSRLGLIQQLSSSAGDGYPKADATWAVDHLNADWNEQAVRSGKTYLDMSGFSRAGLIAQLSSNAGDRYTKAQSTYAADKLGL
jgi:hypothetical protein